MKKNQPQDSPEKEVNPWDNRMEGMFSIAPEDMVAWLLQGVAEFSGLANTELESKRVFSDMLCYVTVGGKKAMLHVEFQKTRDASMARRLWEYNVRTTIKYQRPVRSFVIYLTKDSVIQESYHLIFPDDVLVHWFHFDELKMWEIPTEDLFQAGLPGVLPLLPMAREGQQREVVERAISLLLPLGEEPQRELLFLLYGFASLAFESRDQDWLHERFDMLYDILRDTPAFQAIAKRERREGIERGIEQGRAEGRAQALKDLRQVAADLVAARFASAALSESARRTLDRMDDILPIQRLIINLAVVQTPEDVRQVLTNLQ